jgi:hypothetical protein
VAFRSDLCAMMASNVGAPLGATGRAQGRSYTTELDPVAP